MQKVMITGAGGSIGSALCKSLCSPQRQLVLYEQSELALYTISEELQGMPIISVLGDIKNTARIADFMRGCDTVFHCAAYKHVPLLEGINASEAFTNNIEGTRSVLTAAAAMGVESLVLLSTDKAINPAGVMGRSKRAAEELALQYGRVVAQLGNILESSGSVVPKFRRQIAEGGPVTVTHPEATRYFVTMDEAVRFLRACAVSASGRYLIDMGEPRRIVDLAREMIGDKPIDIVFTGLRPGEKLHEELEMVA